MTVLTLVALTIASLPALAQVGDETPGPTEPPVEQPTDEPAPTDPPVEQPPVEEPPVEQPPVEEPPVEQPPIEQPPVVEPPVEDPIGDMPPVVDKPPVESVSPVSPKEAPVQQPPVINEAPMAAPMDVSGDMTIQTVGDPGAPSGDGIVPEYMDGNPSCPDLGYAYGFKVEPPTSGTYTFLSDGVNTVTITTTDGVYFDWVSTLGLDAVIVKGGPNANLYVYDPPAENYADTGLHAPINPANNKPSGLSHIEFCYDYEPYTLSATKDASASYKRTYTWNITKDFDGEYWKFIGDPATTHNYTVAVDQIVADSDFVVTGSITVTNPAPYNVQFSVADMVDGTPAAVICPSSVISAGGSVTCTYSASLSAAINGTNTATISSTTPVITGTSASAGYTFGEPTVVEYPTVNVTDSNGQSWSASGDDSWAYTKDFTCPTDPNQYVNGVYSFPHVNTATITETGQSDSATVTVHCYSPVVSKTALTSYTRTYTWDIDKEASATYNLFAGQSVTHNYLVSVKQGFEDSAFGVYGAITVVNPHPSAQMPVSLVDSVNGIPATLDCGGSLNVPAGGSASCGYSAPLDAKADGTNSATVSFQGYDFAASMAYAFGEPTNVVGFSAINVTDNNGMAWSASGDDSWTYSKDFACPTDTSLYVNGVYVAEDHVNVASITEIPSEYDTATVKLTCYAPIVSKDATATWWRDIDWTIEKSVTPAAADRFAGEDATFNYTVSVTKSEADEFVVSGKITVTNPAGSPGEMTISVADMLDDVTAATVDCGDGTANVVVAPGATASCDYSGTLAAKADGTNTATATFNSIAFQATAPYAFGAPTYVSGSEPENIMVTDTNGESWSTGSSMTWNYSEVQTCSSVPGDYTDGFYSENFDNTATIDPTGDNDSETVTLHCYAPVVSKDAAATWYKTIDWTIEKSVDPASADRFAGDSATFDYTVQVTKNETFGPYVVSGKITVANPAGAPGDITVDVADSVAGTGASVDCGGGSTSLTVEPGATAFCDYTANLGGAIDGMNTATVTFNEIDFPASADYAFGDPLLSATSEPESITVNDTNGKSWSTGVSATWPYSVDQTCSSVPGDYTDGFYSKDFDNTATIDPTGDNDSETVTLNCYAPVVSKDASTEWYQKYDWTITKSADPTSHVGFAGDSFTSDYDVVVNQTITEYGYAVSGKIWVENPAPMAMAISGVSDDLDVGVQEVAATVTCPSLSIPAGETLECSYSATLGGAWNGTNYARATLNGITFIGQAPVIFGDPTIEGYPTINVTDTYGGELGSASGDFTFEYSREFECSSNPADYDGGYDSDTYGNTATIVETEQSDDASVTVDCYAPVVTKDVSTEWYKKYDWTITKSADPTSHVGFAGDSFTSDYDVVVDQTITEYGYKVSGTIWVENSAPMAMAISSVSDDLDVNAQEIAATVECPSLSIPAGETLECTYSAPLGGAWNGTNYARATLNGITFTGQAPVIFGDPTIEGYPEINVTDAAEAEVALGSASADKTFTYSKDFLCPTDTTRYVDGKFSFVRDNIASIEETGASAEASVTVDCYIPSIVKTAAGSYDEVHTWDVEKTVSPTEQSAFAGDTVEFDWTVTVTESVSEANFAVSGTITVVNPNPEDALVVALADALTDFTPATIIASDTCAYADGMLTVPAGQTAVCGYSAAPSGRTATENVASFYLNKILFVASDPIEWTPNVIDDTAQLIDLQVPLNETVTGDGSFIYTDSYTCSTDQSEYPRPSYSYMYTEDNLATLTWGSGSDSAEATTTVNCYAPGVKKTATPSLTRTWTWDIDKEADGSYDLFAGESVLHDYIVSVTPTSADSDWAVSGMITLYNPAPMPVTISSVSDVISPDIAADVTCTHALPYDLPSHWTLVCTYSAALPDAAFRTNTATVTIGNGTAFTGTADVDFSKAVITEINPVITVDDDNLDDEIWSADRVSAYWEYSKEFECSDDPADYTGGKYSYDVKNTATIVETEQSDDALVTVNCYAPVVSKDAVTTYTRTHHWDIDKSVTPAEWNLFTGDSGTSAYTVSVDKTGFTDSGWAVSGTIKVVNPAPMAMEVDLSDAISGFDGEITLTCANPITVPANDFVECDYSAALLDAEARTNTATATLNGIAFSGTADVIFGEPTTEINAEVNVTDTNGQSWGPVSDDASWTYTKMFTCDGDEGPHGNTATIVETEQSDDASVMVDCHALTVTKTAETSFTRTWEWEIDKSVTPAAWDLFTGDSGTSAYTVTVTKTGYVDSDWKVTGVITITNPAPIAAELASVKDIIRPMPGAVDDVVVDCGVTFPYTLAAGQTLECTYYEDLPSGDAFENRANVRLINYDYDAEGGKTKAGTTQFTSGYLPFDFTNAVITQVNASVNVVDTNGQSWMFSDSGSVSYERKFTCDGDEGEHDNTATMYGDNDLILGSDDASVMVNCHALDVTKTAETSFTRTWEWEIDKSVTPAAWDLFTGDSGTSAYTVTVTKTGYVDSDFKVTGVITITNPAPMDAELESVKDILKVGSTNYYPAVECPSMIVPANGVLECTYSIDLPSGDAFENRANVRLINYDYDAAGGKTKARNTQFTSGYLPFDFGNAVITQVNASVNVVDTNGQSWMFSDSGSVSYERTFTCDGDEGEHDNTATIVETGQSDDASVMVNCHALTVTKTAETSFTRTWEWEIDKSVTPAAWDLFTGDSGMSEYTVTVTKAGYVDSDWKVTGVITITNPAPIAAELASVKDIIRPMPGAVDDVVVDCGVTFPYTLAAGQTLECTYSEDLPDAAVRRNTANVRINNYNYDAAGVGAFAKKTTPFTSGPVSIDFSNAVITQVNASVNVIDSNGMEWGPVSEDMSWTYTKTFTCDGDEGQHGNTATIVETGQSDDASVMVNCFALDVTKTAETSFTRTWEWEIEKVGDVGDNVPGTVDKEIFYVESFPANYTVTVNATHTDSDWLIEGVITITNPAPMDATVTNVDDYLALSAAEIVANVDCGDFSGIIPAGETLECTYTATPGGARNGTNTATITLQNYDYDKDKNGTASSTTGFSGEADVIFNDTPTTEIDECIDVTDDKYGPLGTVCASDAPKTFTYTLTVGPYEEFECGMLYEFTNIASFVTNDTGTTGSDSWTVEVNVKCLGCTLTQGYWKTHSRYGPAPYDPTWALIGEDTTFFLSNQTYYQVITASTKGNAYYILAQQYIAAELNVLNDAYMPPAVTAAFDQATTLFETYTPTQVADKKFDKTIRAQFISLAYILDQYNNGLMGVPHCD